MLLPSYIWPATLLARAELGDLATWLSATASLATVVLALVASLVGFRVYKIESARDQRAEQDREDRSADERRRQAELVSVWYASAVKESREESGFLLERMHRTELVRAAHLLNASELPIYDVTVTFLRRHVSYVDLVNSDSIRAVPPHQGIKTVELPERMANKVPTDQLPDGFDVVLWFRDAASRRWLRDENGYLREFAAPPSPGAWHTKRWR